MRLPAELQSRIDPVIALARHRSTPVYLVGGVLRDLLLGRETRDLDFSVEGDSLGLARALAAETGGEIREHAAFQTAAVVDAAGFRFDFAPCRDEVYRAPAVLPEIVPGGLRADLRRRDFTVNALALRLDGSGELIDLIDLHGGVADLERRALRILHPGSFRDDPTRALRGIRFELRFGFRMTAETLAALAEAVAAGHFAALSGARWRQELELLWGDPALAAGGVERMAELGLLAALHPRLAPSARVDKVLKVHGQWPEGVDLWRLVLAALAADLSPGERGELADRLLLAGGDRRALMGLEERQEAREILTGEQRPHAVAAALDRLQGDALLLLLAESGDGERRWVERYLRELRPLALAVRGADLLAAGVSPGPEIGRALAATRRARLDGEIGAAEELAYALSVLK
jgi:tRNA nucleotidyltransferase (CCA-adding enzyme)